MTSQTTAGYQVEVRGISHSRGDAILQPVFATLIAMTHAILHELHDREVLLFYGVRNSREHAFAESLKSLAAHEPRLQYVPCYSQPLPRDRAGDDFVAARRIDAELLQRVLTSTDYPFYVCGPGAFMENIVEGLRTWGVADSDLHFEAFGPSTVKRAVSDDAAAPATPLGAVTFRQSSVSAPWHADHASLLTIAEAQNVALPSGCRSGNCGMCAVRLLGGKVRYPQTPVAMIDPGFCLTCVAQPDAPEVVLDA